MYLLFSFSGQYDGLKKPLPEYHVKVAGFDERVSASSFTSGHSCKTLFHSIYYGLLLCSSIEFVSFSL